jgi:glycosyltransferase involved in cell wall biosynthesis
MTIDEVEQCERAMREADGIIVSSDFVQNGLLDIGVPASRIRIVPPGGDRLHTVQTLPSVASRRDSVGPLRILWVGQPIARKGFPQFLKAAGRMPHHSVELALVFPSTATIAIPQRADFPPVCLHSHVTGEELRSLYLAHDVLVMPSLYEGFGMVYAEALNAGLPVICTPNTGVATLISQGIDGWVIDPGDADALTDLLLACAVDVERIRAMRAAATALGARLTWSRFRSELIESICDLEAAWGWGAP